MLGLYEFSTGMPPHSGITYAPGVEPASPLEQILFGAMTGMAPEAIRAWWPPDTAWIKRPNAMLAPSRAIAPFAHVEYNFGGRRLRAQA